MTVIYNMISIAINLKKTNYKMTFLIIIMKPLIKSNLIIMISIIIIKMMIIHNKDKKFKPIKIIIMEDNQMLMMRLSMLIKILIKVKMKQFKIKINWMRKIIDNYNNNSYNFMILIIKIIKKKSINHIKNKNKILTKMEINSVKINLTFI
jgi:hypothetical protein